MTKKKKVRRCQVHMAMFNDRSTGSLKFVTYHFLASFSQFPLSSSSVGNFGPERNAGCWTLTVIFHRFAVITCMTYIKTLASTMPTSSPEIDRRLASSLRHVIDGLI